MTAFGFKVQERWAGLIPLLQLFELTKVVIADENIILIMFSGDGLGSLITPIFADSISICHRPACGVQISSKLF